MPSKKDIKFAVIMSVATTFIVTLVLVGINVGFTEAFLFSWLKNWSIAAFIVCLSILFIAPLIRKMTHKE
ncbi:MAG: DUF2798 domain-containing protein [Bacteroidia bacterium]|nr:DUF2798 domain-containing protein [Bacteroidia bacterium]